MDYKNTQKDIIFYDLPPIFAQKGGRKQAAKGVNQANWRQKPRQGDTYAQKDQLYTRKDQVDTRTDHINTGAVQANVYKKPNGSKKLPKL